MPASVSATVTAFEVDSKGREWERIELSNGHRFVLGPNLATSVPFCWPHKSLSCWGALTFVERKAISDAEPLPGPAWTEPAW